ncbi:MAG: hypothetical protein ACLGG7_08985 [Bacteriovoracia bacterium]
MDLAELLRKYPDVRLLDSHEADGRVRDFFHRAPMSGKGLQLQYQRAPSFRAFLECHAEKSFVFYVESATGEIEGAGTLVIRPGMVQGQREMVGYLGDLRIDNIRRWGRYWRDFYFELMKVAPTISEFCGARFYYTAVLHQNTKARKALGESKIGYHPFHSYQMVNVFKQWAPVLDRFHVKTWDTVSLSALEDFYRETNRAKPLGWVVDDDYSEIKWRLKHWPGFSARDGFVLEDHKGIALAAALWSPSPRKKIVVQRLPSAQKRLVSFFGALVPMPREGEELRCLYLTTLDRRPGLSDADWQKGFLQLVKIGLREAHRRGFHCLSVAEFPTQELSFWPFVALKTNLELYFVDPSTNPCKEFSREVPGFEMGLV